MATGTAVKGLRRQDLTMGYAFLTPALIILIVFLVVPMLLAFWVSFREWTGLQPVGESTFVGLENYRNILFEDSVRRSDFARSIRNTLYYVMFVVPIQTAIALCLAVIVNQAWLRGRGFFRTAYYFPAISSSVAISLIFLFLYQKGGLINYVLSILTFGRWSNPDWLTNSNGLFHNFLGLFGVTIDSVPALANTDFMGISLWDWLSGPSVAMSAIIMLNIWTTIGTMMLIFLAALQGIPSFVYEAAALDGATTWQTFRKITVPLLRPTTFFVVTIGLIGTFQVFDQIFVMAPGERSTLTIAYMVYRTAFRNASMGEGTAIAFILFVIIFAFTLLQRRITDDKADL
jgi:multiple sugar transport system permease protein